MGRSGPIPRENAFYRLAPRDGRVLPVVYATKKNGPPYVLWPGPAEHLREGDLGYFKRHPLAGYRGYIPVLKLAAMDYGLAAAEDLERRLVVIPIDGDAWNWDRANLYLIARRDYFLRPKRTVSR
jgi:hypothetical protein